MTPSDAAVLDEEMEVGADVSLAITLDGDDEPTVILRADGQVEFGPNYDPSRAAEAFWKTLSDYNPLGVAVNLLKKLADGCDDHRSYRGKREPRVSCLTCEEMHEARDTLSAMGVL